MSKKCSKCNIEKELDMFGKFNRKTQNGVILTYKYACRSCETETQRNRRNKEKDEDPEKYHKKWADYYAKTKNENKKAFNWKNTWAMLSSDNFSKRKKIIPEELIEHKKLLDKYIIKNKIV
jgi:hypothetical protein